MYTDRSTPQGLDIHHLLDGLRRQHVRMLRLHGDTILDADAHAAEVLRPPGVVGNVDAPKDARKGLAQHS